MIISLRMIGDFFWEFKLLNAALAFLLISQASLLFVSAVNSGNKLLIQREVVKIISVAFLFISLVLYALMENNTEGARIIALKIIANFSAFFYGILCRKERAIYKFVLILSVVEMIYIFLMALLGQGYEYWGDILTFVGPFFYKTDLALAVIIASAFIFCARINGYFYVVYAILAAWVIWMSNSRASMVSFLAVVGLSYYYIGLKARGFNFLRIIVLFLVVLFLVYWGLKEFGGDYLALKVDGEFFSDENTQGRSLIWGALLAAFFQGDALSILFGNGLGADRALVAYKTVLDVDSHNTFIFLLYNMGVFGIFVFLWFIFLIFRVVISFSSSIDDSASRRRLVLCIAFLIVFLINSFSASVLAYQQISWFALFYFGVVLRENNKVYIK